MQRTWRKVAFLPMLFILMLLAACRGGDDRYELTNYMGKSISSFERQSKTELTEQGNGVYLMEGVVQVLLADKDVSAITLLENAGKYMVFGVKIGMSRQDAQKLLQDPFGSETAKTINAEKNTITYSYLKNNKELYISYDIDQETVVELSYYNVPTADKQEETKEEPTNSGELMVMVGDTRVYFNEAMVYLKSVQEKYEKDYGKTIWDADILGNGETFGKSIKREVINQITELKIIRSEAEKQGITLSEEELSEAASYAKEHYEGLSDTDVKQYLITEELLKQVYEDNLLANKLFEYLTINVDTEVADELAKQVTIQNIVIYNTDYDIKGNKIAITDEEKAAAYEKVQGLLQQAKETEDFHALAEANTEADLIEYTFGKDQAPKEYGDAFAQAALALKTGEVSDIITTDYGWHILYCVTDYNKEATIQVKEKIIDDRRNVMFSELYADWTKEYDIVINDEAWNKITFQE